MTSELKKLIRDRYTDWASLWGLSLAFAVTQNADKAERIVADAIVALIAAEVERHEALMIEARAASFKKESDSSKTQALKFKKIIQVPTSVSPLKFGKALWELASTQAFRGFGADSFFRMPAIARAIVVLKTKAQFSVQQIAQAISTPENVVEDHLENARLLFSDGRPWIETTPGLDPSGNSWVQHYTQWRATATRKHETREQEIQGLFAQYVGNDLDIVTSQKLRNHLLACSDCRTSFSNFRRNYSDWTNSIPSLEPSDEQQKYFQKLSKMALGTKRSAPPRALPGIRKILREGNIQAMVMGAGLFIFGQVMMHRHPHFLKTLVKMIYHAKSGR